jgi:hypothetical protein
VTSFRDYLRGMNFLVTRYIDGIGFYYHAENKLTGETFIITPEYGEAFTMIEKHYNDVKKSLDKRKKV